VWTIPDYLLNDVFQRSLRHDGKYFSLMYNKLNYIYFYAFYYGTVKNLLLFWRISGNSQEISVIHLKPEQRE
jgi:hypothetical protein